MIIEVNQDKAFRHSSYPERGQMMKIPGSVKQERRELRPDFLEKLLNQTRWRGKTQFGTPIAQINAPADYTVTSPRAVEIKVQRVGQRIREDSVPRGGHQRGQSEDFRLRRHRRGAVAAPR